MVFESIISNLLNSVLDDFVENLNASQLNIAIWKGHVVLNNLRLKSTALDKIDLPFPFPLRIKFGLICKLTAKIPWTNIYSAPLIVEVDGVYVLIVSHIGIKYNAEEEAKQAQRRKMSELAKIEEARIKGSAKNGKDTFADKIGAQIIRNLQVSVRNIHVRYEDEVTNKKRPFAAGFTLNSLYFQSTNDKWKPMILTEAGKFIYKLIDLNSVAFYWNCFPVLYNKCSNETEILEYFKKADKGYILDSISLSVHVKLNPKSATDGTNFKTPRIFVTMSVQEILLSLGSYQYEDILLLAEAKNRLKLNAIYRKFRPHLKSYKNHPKKWWRFAIKCVLDEIHRRHVVWSWNYIKIHRKLLKSYANAWFEKLTNKNITKNSLKLIENAEMELDAFSLNIGRQMAELEVNHRGLTRPDAEKGWVAWFGEWFGGREKDKTKAKSFDVAKEIEKEWTPAEKAKLYAAIDYHENEGEVHYPPEFVDKKIEVLLETLSIYGYDDSAKRQRMKVLVFKMEKVTTDIIQKPSTCGLWINVQLPKLVIKGNIEKSRYSPVLQGQEFCMKYTLNEKELMGTTVNFAVHETTLSIYLTSEKFLHITGWKKPPPREESVRVMKARKLARKNVWAVKNVQDCKFWFLRESASMTEIFEVSRIAGQSISSVYEELLVSLIACNITVQTVAIAPASPIDLFLLVFEFNSTIQNWNQDLFVEGGMSLEISYFNEKLNVWEPVIEPIELTDSYKPWALSLNVQSQSYYAMMDDEHLPPPKRTIAISSSDTLQLTLTRSLLEMFDDFRKDLFKPTVNTDSDLDSSSQSKKRQAPVTFHNVLPYSITISGHTVKAVVLRSGECVSWNFPVSIKIWVEVKIMTPVVWSSNVIVKKTDEELTVNTFTSIGPDQSTRKMDFGIRTTTTDKTLDLSLYCPFWMVNKTGLPLAYKAGTVHFEHTAESQSPVLLTFNGKRFFRKKKICLKVNDSDWSKEFPVDTIGSAGQIVCKTNLGYNYEVSLTVQLSHSGLTKICTFTPFYLIDNNCKKDIEVREADSNHWLRAPANQVVPFWPKSSKKNRLLHVRYCGTAEESLPFPFTESFEAFAMIPNEFVGVDVCCHVSENSVVVEVEDYQDGLAPALIINATQSFTLLYAQDQVNEWKSLDPGQCALFSWQRLTCKRSLIWSCGSALKVKDDLFKDGTGDYSATEDENRKGYWVSFLDSRQRVLLFTEDLTVAVIVQAYETERISEQYTFSFDGVGMSLVDNQIGTEIAFISVTSSRLVWEYKDKRFKVMSQDESGPMEIAYNRYTEAKLRSDKIKPKQTFADLGLEVDFELMHQYKPVDRTIRRSFQAGFWMQYKHSAHQEYFHVKINHIQIDNQLPDNIFSVACAPIPSPPSVVAENIPKPFAEVSYVARKAEHSTVPQVKYFKILVQEMAVRLDQGFINAMLSFLYGTTNESLLYTTALYRKDLELTNHDLIWYASVISSSEQKAFYDYLHFSPIKVHFSFAQGGYAAFTATKASQIPGEFLNLFIKSLGVTLTEVQDVVFKLAYFERQAVFLNWPQLWAQVMDHYTKQAIKQAYVLILGLDIIGNPFGLMRDLSTGVETFFYEPFQGAILGPEEFAEGLALGVTSFFGSTVGGAAGALSRITGTVGKGLAALTLDKEYQKKRLQTLNRKGKVHESLLQGGRGLVMGFYEGVTGVVTRPVQGAREEGVPGFFKGMGKGVVGFFAFPASGIIDCTSTSFDAVKRIVGVTNEINRIRYPRLILPDKIIHIYSAMEAEGNYILQTVAKGKYGRSDKFIACASLTDNKDFHLIVTDKRIMFIKRDFLCGNLDIDWMYTWDQLAEAPYPSKSSLIIKFKKPKKKLFRKEQIGRSVHLPDEHCTQWIAQNCRDAYNAADRK